MPRGLLTLPLRQSLLACTNHSFRFAAPKSIRPLRQHRLSANPILCSLALKPTSLVRSLCLLFFASLALGNWFVKKSFLLLREAQMA